MVHPYLERRGPREEHLQLEAEEVVADHHVGVLRLQAGEEPGSCVGDGSCGLD